MSFSGDVKRELCEVLPGSRHCRIAELAAILGICGKITVDEKGKCQLWIQTENLTVAKKYFTLMRKAFHAVCEVSVRRRAGQKKGASFTVILREDTLVREILLETGLLRSNDAFPGEDIIGEQKKLLHRDCCKRAYLRGTFLATGTITDPEKSYHFELVTPDYEKAVMMRDLIGSFPLDPKIVTRGKNFVVYVKEGEQIVDLLNLMGAHVALMNLENVRIVKEVRNQINRGVNCEAANIKKTVNASRKQVEDITYIKQNAGLASLPDNLETIARLRLSEPDISLAELGERLDPPLGKSGVNHRLRKISMIADSLRQKKGESL